MTPDQIIQSWKNKQFKSFYWLDGEEEYYIDQVIHYAEHHILNESEAGFNLTVLYGRDTDWSTVVNACMRYPMFAERQVVVLKEAQAMRDLDKLESYLSNPLSSTVFVVGMKDKKVDGRSKLAKALKSANGVYISTKKLYDNELPNWITQMLHSKGLKIQPKANALLVDHIGNDLTRLQNEIDKILVNTGKVDEITDVHIEQFVGISREYNVFEFQKAVAMKDLSKAIKIVQYFEQNPKAGPMVLILGNLYAFFAKLYQLMDAKIASADDTAKAKEIGVHPYVFREYKSAFGLYQSAGIEKALLLLQAYNLKAVGIGDIDSSDADLLKELLVKLMY